MTISISPWSSLGHLASFNCLSKDWPKSPCKKDQSPYLPSLHWLDAVVFKNASTRLGDMKSHSWKPSCVTWPFFVILRSDNRCPLIIELTQVSNNIPLVVVCSLTREMSNSQFSWMIDRFPQWKHSSLRNKNRIVSQHRFKRVAKFSTTEYRRTGAGLVYSTTSPLHQWEGFIYIAGSKHKSV